MFAATYSQTDVRISALEKHNAMRVSANGG